MKKVFRRYWLLFALTAAFGVGRLAGLYAPALTSKAMCAAAVAGLQPDQRSGSTQSALTPTGLKQSAPTATPPAWRPAERYQSKHVPVIRLRDGARLGVARVNGPRSRVALTQVVAQLSVSPAASDTLPELAINIYIPLAAREPGQRISRLQGVGVSGLGDSKL